MSLTPEERQKIIDKGNILIDNTLFADFYSMEDAEIGLLMRSIGRYVGTGEIVPFTKDQRVVKMAFNRFKVSHDANGRKYIIKCAKSKEAIEKRWEDEKKK